MSNRFYITGLPRSRTAWFAVATTTPRSICYHEPTAHTSTFEDLVDLWRPHNGVSIGVSDSALALQTGLILDGLKPRTLIIDRPIADVIESFDDYMMGTRFDLEKGREWLEACEVELAKHRSNPLVKSVAFDALDNHETVIDCLRWLVPDADFVDVRFLMTMNIQVHRDYVLSLASRPHTKWHMQT